MRLSNYETTMKIALVHEYLTTFAGSEQVLLALHELYPEAPIYTAIYNPEKCPQFRTADIRTSFLQKFPQATTKHQRYIPLLPLAVEGYDLSGYDVVISDSHIAAKGIITKPETIHICYCHTPIRYAWSPEVDPRASGSPIRRFANHYLRLWDAAAAERVDYWLANSNYIARRIQKYYRVPSTVIYPPVDVYSFHLEPKQEDYFVFFSRLIDYKKPNIVIEAFNKMGKRLIVMGKGPEKERLQAFAHKNIEFLGYVSDKTLRDVFAKAQALIFPAEEDFGITMVEAMAAGRPVIAYNAGAAPEIITPGKTGELLASQSVEAIIEAVADWQPMRYDSKAIREAALRYDRSVFKKQIENFVNEKFSKRKT